MDLQHSMSLVVAVHSKILLFIHVIFPFILPLYISQIYAVIYLVSSKFNKERSKTINIKKLHGKGCDESATGTLVIPCE